jgi:hypothetical protein
LTSFLDVKKHFEEEGKKMEEGEDDVVDLTVAMTPGA